MVRNRLSPCGPSIGPRTQLQITRSRSTRPLAESSARLLRATRGPLRFILWARTCACMTTYVQVRNLWAGGRAGQKALFPAFQAGHAGSIPVARSSCYPWSGALNGELLAECLASIPRISREPSEMVITGAAWAISESAAASTASRSLVACW